MIDETTCAVGLTYCQARLNDPVPRIRGDRIIQSTVRHPGHRQLRLFNPRENTNQSLVKVGFRKKTPKVWGSLNVHKTSFTDIVSSHNSLLLNLMCTVWKDWNFV